MNQVAFHLGWSYTKWKVSIRKKVPQEVISKRKERVVSGNLSGEGGGILSADYLIFLRNRDWGELAEG